MINKSKDLTAFETLTAVENGLLVGGFSSSIIGTQTSIEEAADNTTVGCGGMNTCPKTNRTNCGCGKQ
jgi:hypothetical protein